MRTLMRAIRWLFGKGWFWLTVIIVAACVAFATHYYGQITGRSLTFPATWIYITGIAVALVGCIYKVFYHN